MRKLNWFSGSKVKELVNTKEEFKLEEGDKTFLGGVQLELEIAKNPKEGLSKRTSLCHNCGMVFFFDGTAHITTKETKLPLDIIFIQENRIVKIITATPFGDQYMYPADCVIELNSGFCRDNNINVGDYLQVDKKRTEKQREEDLEQYMSQANYRVRYKKGGKRLKSKIIRREGLAETSKTDILFQSPGDRRIEKKFKNAPMARYQNGGESEDTDSQESPLVTKSEGTYLLDEKGDVQMVMQGNERIFSRIHTRKILSLIKKIDDEKDPIKLEKLLENLGVLVADIILTHDTQEEEYTED